VRLLSNIETQKVKLLNVVLAGQPELGGRLNEPGLRQLKQRIGLRCELASLDFPETAAYIAGRLRIAGGEPQAIFSREAIMVIHDMSAGVARTINVICDNALIGGFALQAKPVTRSIVEEVCRDFDLKGIASSSDVPPFLRVPVSTADARTGRATLQSANEHPPVRPPEPAESSERDQSGPSPMFSDMGRKRRFW
jgi:hypothetical protein